MTIDINLDIICWKFQRAAQVFPFEQLARLRNLPEEYEPPEAKPFKPRVDPSSWLADEHHRDQFVLRYSEPHPSGKPVRNTTEKDGHCVVILTEKHSSIGCLILLLTLLLL